MVKLLRNEWRRYGVVAVSMAVGIAIIAVFAGVCIMFYEESSLLNVMTLFSYIIFLIIMHCIPLAAFVIPVISYSVDISRRGLLFLTPVSVWLAIIEKVLFGVAVSAVLCIESQWLTWLLNTMAAMTGSIQSDGVTDIPFSDLFSETSLFSWSVSSFVVSVTKTAHSALSIMAAIALARFAVNNTAACVVLSIVFSYLLGLVENMIFMLVTVVTDKTEFMYGVYGGYLGSSDFISTLITVCSNIIYAGIFYFLCTYLTTKKINLAY